MESLTKIDEKTDHSKKTQGLGLFIENYIQIPENFFYKEEIDEEQNLLNKHKNECFNIESSESFFNETCKHREIFLNEKWDIIENIHGVVINFNETNIHIDCLIDRERNIFQHRSYPIYLFRNIENLSVSSSVIIKAKMKNGSLRIDTYKGEGIVNKELFKLNSNWDNLSDAGLDKKLTKW